MGSEETLQGKTVLVTGASAGIGRETVHSLAEAGADVVLAARREEQLSSIADAVEAEHGVETLVVPTNVTEIDQVEALIDASLDTFGTLDVVVINAGIGAERGVDVDEYDVEQYRAVMDVNTDGMFYTARSALSHLRESSGLLIFVGSIVGHYPSSSDPVYAASKWWTRGFAFSIAAQMDEADVGVTVVNPSGVRTEFGKEYQEMKNEEQFEPGDVLEPEAVAETIAFAAQQEPPNVVSELDIYHRKKFDEF